MARLFDDASTEYLEVAQAVVSSPPFATVAWFRSDDLTISQEILCIGDVSANDQYRMFIAGDLAGDYLRVDARDNSTARVAITTVGYTANRWHHAAGIQATTSDRRALIDNGGKGTSGTTSSLAGLDTTRIGAFARNPPILGFSGLIAEVAIWDLTSWPGATGTDKADEFERLALPGLAAGFSPSFFPLGLVAYWPLGGYLSSPNSANASGGDRDIIGGYHMSPYNTPSTADHPPVHYPGRRQQVFPAAVAAGTILPQMLQQGLYAGAL